MHILLCSRRFLRITSRGMSPETAMHTVERFVETFHGVDMINFFGGRTLTELSYVTAGM